MCPIKIELDWLYGSINSIEGRSSDDGFPRMAIESTSPAWRRLSKIVGHKGRNPAGEAAPRTSAFGNCSERLNTAMGRELP